MLTKEQIEEIRRNLEAHHHDLRILCDMALTAQPKQAEPVAWMYEDTQSMHQGVIYRSKRWADEETPKFFKVTPLYTAPPSRPGWLPIETAPEDEAILIFAEPDWVGEASWVSNDEGDKLWRWAGGAKIHALHAPKLWMPLPAAPKEGE